MKKTMNAKDTVAAVIGKLPQWIRHDLAAQDSSLRARAEESLAAMIAAAIGDGGVGAEDSGGARESGAG